MHVVASIVSGAIVCDVAVAARVGGSRSEGLEESTSGAWQGRFQEARAEPLSHSEGEGRGPERREVVAEDVRGCRGCGRRWREGLRDSVAPSRGSGGAERGGVDRGGERARPSSKNMWRVR